MTCDRNLVHGAIITQNGPQVPNTAPAEQVPRDSSRMATIICTSQPTKNAAGSTMGVPAAFSSPVWLHA
jgi:hypothetical protein